MLPPYREDILCYELVEQLKIIYSQLYPSFCIGNCSPFFEKSGRVTYNGQLVGSVLSGTSSNSLSVVMAYWPSSGDVLVIDYSSKMKVGVVQYFLQAQNKTYTSQQCSIRM